MKLLWRLADLKRRKRENVLLWISRHLPGPVVYWTVIYAATHNADGTPYQWNPAERRVIDILKEGGYSS